MGKLGTTEILRNISKMSISQLHFVTMDRRRVFLTLVIVAICVMFLSYRMFLTIRNNENTMTAPAHSLHKDQGIPVILYWDLPYYYIPEVIIRCDCIKDCI